MSSSSDNIGFFHAIKNEFIRYEPIQILKSGIAGAFFGWVEVPPIFQTGGALPYHATAAMLIAPFILPPLARFTEKIVNILTIDDELRALKFLENATKVVPEDQYDNLQFRKDMNEKYDLIGKVQFRRHKMREKGYRNKRWDSDTYP